MTNRLIKKTLLIIFVVPLLLAIENIIIIFKGILYVLKPSNAYKILVAMIINFPKAVKLLVTEIIELSLYVTLVGLIIALINSITH